MRFFCRLGIPSSFVPFSLILNRSPPSIGTTCHGSCVLSRDQLTAVLTLISPLLGEDRGTKFLLGRIYFPSSDLFFFFAFLIFRPGNIEICLFLTPVISSFVIPPSILRNLPTNPGSALFCPFFLGISSALFPLPYEQKAFNLLCLL